MPFADMEFLRQFLDRRPARSRQDRIDAQSDGWIVFPGLIEAVDQKRFGDGDPFGGVLGRLHLFFECTSGIAPDFGDGHCFFGQFAYVKIDQRLQSRGLETHAENPDFSGRLEFDEFFQLAVDEVPLLDFGIPVFEFLHQIGIIENELNAAVGEYALAGMRRRFVIVVQVPVTFDVARQFFLRPENLVVQSV